MKINLFIIVSIFIFLSSRLVLAGSTYNMATATVSTCSGTFYDNGGTGIYTNNQNLTFTICPSTPGAQVRVNFSAFNLENNWDFLYIYNGNSTAAPSLGVYTGTTSPGIVTATTANPSGCLTFRFTSDGSVTSSGWVAAISCVVPCQTITSNFISSNPPPGPDGIIRICQGQSVSFVGSGTFSTSGTGANYQWNFGNGTTANGTTGTATYASGGTYTVNLNITDPNGCTNSNLLNRKVQVSTTPTITTSANPTTVCQGNPANLSANVTMTPFIQNCTPPISGTTFLPDGTGASYNTAINVNCYNTNQTVTSATDIQNVCLNMEHSFIGDLTIRLICPNGQSTILKAYPGGGGTYLGCPLDDPAVGPGTGRLYCFTPTATTLLINGTTSNCGNPAAASINAGNYMPSQPFSNLIGCPLNGAWTIQVTDNLGIDNGYIFNWDVNFNSSIPTNSASSFTPTISSQGWQPNSTLTSTGSTTATVTPTTVGSNCYTYSITDNFGCTYSQNQCINVTAGITPTFTQLGPYCQTTTSNVVTLPTTSSNGIIGTWSTASFNTLNSGSFTFTFTPNAGQCASPTSMTIVINPLPTLSCPPVYNVPGCNSPFPNGANSIAAFSTLGGSTNATSISYSDGSPSTSGCTQTIVRTYTAVLAGCSTTCTQTLNRTTDNQIPLITGTIPAQDIPGCSATSIPAAETTVSGLESLGVSISDNCTSNANLIVTSSVSSTGSCPIVFTRTYTITDACNNQATLTQLYNVGDNIAPVFTTFPNDVTVNCGAVPTVPTATLTASDNCTSSPTISFVGESGTAGNCGYTLNRTWSATDACGNVLNQTQIITVLPAAAPVVTLPSGLPTSLTCAQAETFTSSSSATYTNSESGTCLISGSIAPTQSSSYTSCAGGSITLTYTGTDVCGNALNAQHVITVTPPAAPVVTLPSGLPTSLTYSNAVNYTTAPDATYSNSDVANCLISGLIPAVITPNFTQCNGGSILISYTATDLCGNVLNAQHTIAVSAVIPTVTVFSTLSTINVSGSSQLTAVGTPAGGTYSWSPANTVSPQNGDIVTVNPTTTTTYTVTYDIGGCNASATITINVNALTLSVNSATICSGSSTTLTATPSVGGGSYLWSPGGQITQSITVSPLTNTIYTCVYTLNGVATSPTVGTVTVNQTPTASLNSPTICTGQSANLNATVAPPGGTYLWQPGGQVTPSITVSPIATSTYSLTYTLNGCSTTASSTVTVNPTPTVSVNSSTVCAGQSATLTATVTPAGGTLLWGNSQSTSSITVSPTTTTNYNVLYTLNGCNATGSGTVTVNAVPTVSVSSATVCSGQSATLTATPSATGGTYAWTNNASTTNTISVSPTSTTTYSVTYTLNGCTSQSATGTVTVNQIPTVSVNNPVICIGESATLTASPSTAGGTYVWSPNGETTNAITVTPIATSSYSVTYTLNGCTSQSATGTVTVNPLPTVSFSGDQLTGCAPLTVNFASTGGNPSNCSWSMGNGQTVSGCTTSYTFTQGGCYDISLTTTENGCTNTATLQDYICVENPPVASFTTNPTVLTDPIQVVTFNNNTVGASTYVWEFGDGQSSTEENPVHTYTSTTNGAVITLTTISALGCEATHQVSIQYEEGEIIYIPNTFTPDGDNYNQTFLPIFTSGFDPYNFEMLIFNRWGEIIFETHDAKVGWDGTYGMKGRDVQEGVYTYKVIYKNPLNDKRKIIVGHVSLIK